MMPMAFSRPAGFRVEAIEAATLCRRCSGRPPDIVSFSNRLRRGLRRRDVEERVAPEAFSIVTWESTVGSVGS